MRQVRKVGSRPNQHQQLQISKNNPTKINNNKTSQQQVAQQVERPELQELANLLEQ